MASLKGVKDNERIQLVLELLNKSVFQTKFSLQFGTPILSLYKAFLNVMQDMMSSSLKDKSSSFSWDNPNHSYVRFSKVGLSCRSHMSHLFC